MRSAYEEQFLAPPSPVNEAAFERMCVVLGLSMKERRLALMAVFTYENAKPGDDAADSPPIS